MKIAVIGGGIAGLSAAWLLSMSHDVTLFEATDTIGGHACTVAAENHPAVDAGFATFNDRAYPNFIALLDHLGIAYEPADLSFCISLNDGRTEYGSAALFAQKSLLFSPAYLRMLTEIPRFHKAAKAWLTANPDNYDTTVADFITQQGFSDYFLEKHIIPIGGSIWSTDAARIGTFPAIFFLSFLNRHGLLEIKNRPRWFTVSGGSRAYLAALQSKIRADIRLNSPVQRVSRESSCVRVELSGGWFDKYDHVIFATHCDQTLGLLTDASPAEHAALRAIPYVTNFAVVHQDPRFMPKRPSAWSSINYLSSHHGKVNVTYWLNRLHPYLPYEHQMFVTLNPSFPIAADKEIARLTFAHPLYSRTAIDAHAALPAIQGAGRVWHCGAWTGFGSHEDALVSGLSIAEHITGQSRPWHFAMTGDAA